jgi:uncharacterized protein
LKLTPSAGTARLEHVDAVRGFALALVLLGNLGSFSLYGFLDSDTRALLPTAYCDGVIERVLAALIEHKAATLFAVLFGVSFALQSDRLISGDDQMNFAGFYIRRLLVLLGIGVIHSVFWFGDVLKWYAIMGLLLLPTRRLPTYVAAAIGVIVAVFPWSALCQPAESDGADRMLSSTFDAFISGNVGEMLKGNFHYDWWFRSVEWGYPLAIFGRLLVGTVIGRSQALAQPHEHRGFWLGLASLTLPIGVAFTIADLLAGNRATSMALARFVGGAASFCLGLAYLSIFILLYQRTRWRRLLVPLAAVGRMTLTNYLLQTFIAIVLFYGVGFAIGPRFGLVGVIIFAIVIFAFQIVFSRLWLSRFRFGPVEWVWRCLSYGSVLPFRARRAPTQ